MQMLKYFFFFLAFHCHLNKIRQISEKILNYEADDSFKIIFSINEYGIGTIHTVMDKINNKIQIRYEN